MPTAAPASPGTREDLVEIASDLFYRQGYGATGIKQIIEEAGIAKGTFYTHFKSKEELGVVWLKVRHAAWNQWLADYLAGLRSPAKKILGCFDFLAKWLKESGYRGCAFINTQAEVPDASNAMRAEVAAHKRQMLQQVRQWCHEHFSTAPAKFAEQKGSVIYLLLEGAIIESQNFHQLWPVKAAKTEVESMLKTTR